MNRESVWSHCPVLRSLKRRPETRNVRGNFGTHHRFIGNYEAKTCHFLPATDQLVVSCIDGVWVFDAAVMKSKKLK